MVAAGAIAGLGMMMAPPVQSQDRGDVVYCASGDGQFTRCRTPWPESDLSQQLSKASCVRGQSWESERYTVWVDHGCRANFIPARGWGNGRRERDDDDDDRGRDRDRRPDWDGGWRPGPDWDRPIQLRCESHSDRYQMCQVDVGRNGNVRLVRQLSDSSCQEGETWGWNRAGVWVDDGCRGIFVVDRRW